MSFDTREFRSCSSCPARYGLRGASCASQAWTIAPSSRSSSSRAPKPWGGWTRRWSSSSGTPPTNSWSAASSAPCTPSRAPAASSASAGWRRWRTQAKTCWARFGAANGGWTRPW